MATLTAPAPEPHLRRWQTRIFVLSWLGYASFYLCRVNLAVALPALQTHFGWTANTSGLIGGTFLWVYALGQLINGTLGQKANARWFVGVGMLVSAACNLLFGFSNALWWMILLWGINGWVQSMGWGPIMKTVAAWFGPRRRGRISALFSPCFVLGHLAAWSVGGWLVGAMGWRYAFWLPAAAFGAMGLVWLAGIRTHPQAVGLAGADAPREITHVSAREIVSEMVRTPRLRWAALTCLLASTIKDGLALWAPTFLVDALGLPVQRASLAASILPLLGLCGSLLAGWSSDRFFQSREAPGIVGLSGIVALAMVGFLWLSGGGPLWVTIALLGVCGAAVYGINSLLLTSLPLSFGDKGHVGAVAGFLDFSSYVGGGTSALVVGQLIAGVGWQAVFLFWLATTVLAAGSAVVLDKASARC